MLLAFFDYRGDVFRVLSLRRREKARRVPGRIREDLFVVTEVLSDSRDHPFDPGLTLLARLTLRSAEEGFQACQLIKRTPRRMRL